MGSRTASISIIDIKEEFERYNNRTHARIVMVPKEFAERVRQCWEQNGIPTTPHLLIDGKRLLGVDRMSDG